jgi:hypothetical protein
MITASESVSGAFQLELVKHISMAGVLACLGTIMEVSIVSLAPLTTNFVLTQFVPLGQIGSVYDLLNSRLVLLVDGKLIILSPKTDVSTHKE